MGQSSFGILKNNEKIYVMFILLLIHTLLLFSQSGFNNLSTNELWKITRSHVELWDIKFISTLVWTVTDLSANTTSLMDIFEPHQFFGGGLFGNKSCKSKY